LKNYSYQEAVETLRGILASQDKQLLARELAQLMVKYSDNLKKSYKINDLELQLINDNNQFIIKIGNE